LPDVIYTITSDEAEKIAVAAKAEMAPRKLNTGCVVVMARDGGSAVPRALLTHGNVVEAGFNDAGWLASEVIKTGHSIPDITKRERVPESVDAGVVSGAFKMYLHELRDPEGWVGVISVYGSTAKQINNICKVAAAAAGLFIDVA